MFYREVFGNSHRSYSVLGVTVHVGAHGRCTVCENYDFFVLRVSLYKRDVLDWTRYLLLCKDCFYSGRVGFCEPQVNVQFIKKCAICRMDDYKESFIRLFKPSFMRADFLNNACNFICHDCLAEVYRVYYRQNFKFYRIRPRFFKYYIAFYDKFFLLSLYQYGGRGNRRYVNLGVVSVFYGHQPPRYYNEFLYMTFINGVKSLTYEDNEYCSLCYNRIFDGFQFLVESVSLCGRCYSSLARKVKRVNDGKIHFVQS